MAKIKEQHQEVVLLGPYLLESSKTFNVGDFVAFSDANAGRLDNTSSKVAGTVYVAGLLQAIVDKDGNPFLGTDGGSLRTVTTSSSNTTYYGMIIPTFNEYTFEVDSNATLGTTPNSDKAGVYFDLVSATQVAESSVVLPGGTGAPKQVLSLGPAINPTTGTQATNKVLVKFVKSIWRV